MTRAQVGRRRAEAIRRAGRQVLHEHVGALEEPRQHRLRGGLLEIERQRFLRAIEPDEVARQSADGLVVAAREVPAVGPLDLDHARAEVGELARRERRGDRLLDRHDGDALQWRSQQFTVGQFTVQ